MGDTFDLDPNIKLEPIEFAPSRAAKRPPILLYCVAAGGVLIALTTVAAVVWKLTTLGKSQNVTVAAQQDPGSLRQEAIRVYSQYDAANRDASLSPEEKRERETIRAQFESLAACAASKNDEEFRGMVDFDRLLQRIERTGNLRGYSNLEKRATRTEMRGRATVDPNWAKLTVAGVVTPAGDSSSRVVYTFPGPQADDQTGYRFWIAPNGDSWKIYDWERLDLGISESREWGLYAKYFQSRQMEEFNRWVHFLNEANASIEANKNDEAKQKLHRATTYNVPTEFSGYRWAVTGNHWLGLHELAEAERCYKNVTSPDDTPGVYSGLMQCRRNVDPAQALEYADRYEAAVGPIPGILESKARLCETLGRKDAALEQWKKLLRLQPDNDTAQREILLSLGPDDKSQFEQQLERRADPIEAATELAPYVGYEDPQALQFLLKYLERKAPKSARTLYVAGYSKYVEGEFDEAAKLYRQAGDAEADHEKQRKYLDAYVEAMNSQGRIVEAFKSLPDPKTAIESLFSTYDEGEVALSDDDYGQLVEMYRKRYPAELQGMQWEAQLALSRENYAEAERLGRQAMQHVAGGDSNEESKYQRDALQSLLASALYKLGRLDEAYEHVGDRKERFRQLVRMAIGQRRWADVSALNVKHRAAVPDDPQLTYVDGELAAHEKQWDAAVGKLREAVKGSDKFNQWMAKRRLYEVYAESSHWRDYYTSDEDPDAAFDALANRFIAEQDWSGLDSLISAHERRSPNDASIVKCAADAAWQRGDYDSYIQRTDQLLQAHGEQAINSFVPQQDRLLGALLRTRQLDRALQVAQNRQRSHNDSTELAIFSAATGNMADAKRYAREAAARHEGLLPLYSNEDVGRIFLSSEFSDLQSEFPPRLADNLAPTIGVFFLKDSRQLSVSEIEDVVTRTGIKLSDSVGIVPTGRKSVLAFVVPFGRASIWVATGEGKFDEHWRLFDAEPSLLDAVNNHQHWLAVGTSSWTKAERDRVEPIARRVAGQLAHLRATAASLRRGESWQGFAAYPATPEAIGSWELWGHRKSFEDQGRTISQGVHSEVPTDRSFEMSLGQTAKSFRSAPGTRLEVMTDVSANPAMDPLWLNVSSVKRRYGGLEFTGTLKDQSKLVPELRQGLTMQFDANEVQAWRLNDDSPVYRRPQK